MFHSAAQKRKEANRARDRARKAAASEKLLAKGQSSKVAKGKRKAAEEENSASDDEDSEGGDSELQKRMQRAMQEADEEGSSNESGDEDEMALDDEDDEENSNDDDEHSDSTRNKLSRHDIAQLSADRPQGDFKSPRSSKIPSILPDSIFEEAAADAASLKAKRESVLIKRAKRLEKQKQKRRKLTASGKDIILGYA